MMVSIDSLTFDLSDCSLEEQSEDHRMWVNSIGVAHKLQFDIDPIDWPFDLTDSAAGAEYYRRQCAELGGAMVSLEVTMTAGVDWASRKVLAAKVAITLETCHAVDVLQEAFTRYGKPEMVNTDQGSQFSAQEFVHAVKEQGCKFSMDGRGAWRDNVFVERLWKSVKYERVYLHAYDSVIEARQSIMPYMDWYNHSRPHSSLDKQTPHEAYAVMLPTGKLAA
jgi:hypothetical protein